MQRLLLLLTSSILLQSTAPAAKEQEFRFKKSDAQTMMLMGEFNGWKGQPMTKGSDGTWTAKVTRPAGADGYKFLVDGADWVLDPDNSKGKSVDGVENSAMEVKEGAGSTAIALARERLRRDRRVRARLYRRVARWTSTLSPIAHVTISIAADRTRPSR
ncbi:MAG TPA: glycogen-binding domain-containing protein [Chthoniobacterales bacterium]|nr:glycogen-binding domain-containing protein [Chthoniobacterales bacterium]